MRKLHDRAVALLLIFCFVSDPSLAVANAMALPTRAAPNIQALRRIQEQALEMLCLNFSGHLRFGALMPFISQSARSFVETLHSSLLQTKWYRIPLGLALRQGIAFADNFDSSHLQKSFKSSPEPFIQQEGHLFYGPGFNPYPLDADLYFMRHGRTYGQKDKIFQGDVDGDRNQLDEEGHHQKGVAAGRLFEEVEPILKTNPEQVVVIESPLTRARVTRKAFTDLVSQVLNLILSVEKLEWAREISFGVWDGLSEAEIQERWGDEELRKAKQYRYELNSSVAAHNGMSFHYFLTERVTRLLQHINENYRGKTVLLFGHGTLGNAIRILLGYPEMVDPAGHINWRVEMPNATPIQLRSQIKSTLVSRSMESEIDFDEQIDRHKKTLQRIFVDIVRPLNPQRLSLLRAPGEDAIRAWLESVPAEQMESVYRVLQEAHQYMWRYAERRGDAEMLSWLVSENSLTGVCILCADAFSDAALSLGFASPVRLVDPKGHHPHADPLLMHEAVSIQPLRRAFHAFPILGETAIDFIFGEFDPAFIRKVFIGNAAAHENRIEGIRDGVRGTGDARVDGLDGIGPLDKRHKDKRDHPTIGYFNPIQELRAPEHDGGGRAVPKKSLKIRISETYHDGAYHYRTSEIATALLRNARHSVSIRLGDGKPVKIRYQEGLLSIGPAFSLEVIQDGRIVGYLDASLYEPHRVAECYMAHDHRYTYRVKDAWFVPESHRRLGIGTALMKIGLKIAWLKGAERFTVYGVYNADSRVHYGRLGFRKPDANDNRKLSLARDEATHRPALEDITMASVGSVDGLDGIGPLDKRHKDKRHHPTIGYFNPIQELRAPEHDGGVAALPAVSLTDRNPGKRDKLNPKVVVFDLFGPLHFNPGQWEAGKSAIDYMPEAVHELLRLLKEDFNIQMYVLSTKAGAPAYEIASHFGFAGVEQARSKEDGLVNIMKRETVSAEEMIMVGDEALMGIRPANRLGIFSVGYSANGFKDYELREADMLVRRYQGAVPAILEAWKLKKPLTPPAAPEGEPKALVTKGQRVLLFTLSEAYGLAIIKALRESAHQIVGLATVPQSAELIRWARQMGVSIWDAHAIFKSIFVKEQMKKDAEFRARISRWAVQLEQLQADVAISAMFFYLPEPVRHVVRRTFLNIHPSRLPQYRGGFTLPALILNGEKQTAVTIHEIEPETDAGPIALTTSPIPIEDTDNAETLQQKIVPAATQAIVQVLNHLSAGLFQTTPQGPAQSPHAWGIRTRRVVDPATGRVQVYNEGLLTQLAIHWPEVTTDEVIRRVRAFRLKQSGLGCYTNYRGMRLYLAEAQPDTSGEIHGPGEILRLDKDGGTVIGTQDGAVKIFWSWQVPHSFFVLGDSLATTERVSDVTGIPQSDGLRVTAPGRAAAPIPAKDSADKMEKDKPKAGPGLQNFFALMAGSWLMGQLSVGLGVAALVIGSAVWGLGYLRRETFQRPVWDLTPWVGRLAVLFTSRPARIRDVLAAA